MAPVYYFDTFVNDSKDDGKSSSVRVGLRLIFMLWSCGKGHDTRRKGESIARKMASSLLLRVG